MWNKIMGKKSEEEQGGGSGGGIAANPPSSTIGGSGGGDIAVADDAQQQQQQDVGGSGGAPPPPPPPSTAVDNNAKPAKTTPAATPAVAAPPAPTTTPKKMTTKNPPSEKKTVLNAITMRGDKLLIRRVLVNNAPVSPPASVVGEDHHDDDVIMEEEGGGDVDMMATEGGRGGGMEEKGFERTFSGSTTKSHNSHYDPEDPASTAATGNTGNTNKEQQAPPMEENSTSDNDDEEEDDDDMDDDEIMNANNTTSPQPTTQTHVQQPRRGRSASIGEMGEIMSGEGGEVGEGGGGLSRENSSSSDAAPMTSTTPGGLATTTTAGGGGGTGGEGTESNNFEASLLLGIAATADSSSSSNPATTTTTATTLLQGGEGKEKREPLDPTTLPTSMTSFLDMLTEDQRRVRHRHIPGVDGFRKLYKSEVKSDMSEARKLKRAKHVVVAAAARGDGSSSGGGGIGSDDTIANTATTIAMEVDGEQQDDEKSSAANNSDTNSHNSYSNSNNKEDALPNRNAFIVPDKDVRACATGGQLASMIESTDFENAIKAKDGSGGIGKKKPDTTIGSGGANNTSISSIHNPPSLLLKSPRLIDTLTSYNPPRPQESGPSKTQHRLKRWEANPQEVEADLANYRKTVVRTRSELHNAKMEHGRIESLASLVRNHFMEHLMSYRQEVLACGEQLRGVNEKCFKLEEEYGSTAGGVGGRLRRRTSMSTRGSGGSGKGMKDVLMTLKALGDDVKGVNVGSSGVLKDWRMEGVGGVCSDGSSPVGERSMMMLASGWFLPGDQVKVISTGEEGEVLHVNGPAIGKKLKSSTSKEDKPKSTAPATTSKGGDAMDVDSTPSKEKGSDSSSKKEAVKQDAGDESTKTIGVKLHSKSDGGEKVTVKNFSPSELEFSLKEGRLQTSDPMLAKRWNEMVKTALGHGMDHDVLAMEEYIHSSFIAPSREKEEEQQRSSSGGSADEKDDDDGIDAGKGGSTLGGDDNTKPKDKEDGSSSPKSVAQYEDERSLLPFGSGFIAAPHDIKNYPSLIPLDNLEETVRKAVYEGDGPRVIPTMPAPIKKYELQQEEMNALRGKVLQLRNRLGRQKRLRSLNERSLVAGKSRGHKVEGLLLEMQIDLKNLKQRLQDELNDLGIGNNSLPMSSSAVPENGNSNDNDMSNSEDGAREKGEEKEEEEIPISSSQEQQPDVADGNVAEGDQVGGEISKNADDDDDGAKKQQPISEDGAVEDASTKNTGEMNPVTEQNKEEANNHSMQDESVDNELERESKRARVEE